MQVPNKVKYSTNCGSSWKIRIRNSCHQISIQPTSFEQFLLFKSLAKPKQCFVTVRSVDVSCFRYWLNNHRWKFQKKTLHGNLISTASLVNAKRENLQFAFDFRENQSRFLLDFSQGVVFINVIEKLPDRRNKSAIPK